MPTRPVMDDPYATLGVAPTASAEEIKAAFKARAKALHPDLNRHRDTTAEFQRLQAAYAILEDPRQRELYDLGQTAPEEVIAPTPTAAPHASYHYVGPGRRYRRRVIFAGSLIGAGLFGLAGWHFYPEPEAPKAPPPGAAPIASGTAIDIPGLTPEMQAAIYQQSAQNYSGIQRGPQADVELDGRNGRKFIVSSAVARELEPKRNDLFTGAQALHEREAGLLARRSALDRDRNRLDPSQFSAIKLFNENVEALNRDVAEFERDTGAHAKLVDEYFQELERVALRTR